MTRRTLATLGLLLLLAACATKTTTVEEPTPRSTPERADPAKRSDAHLKLAAAYFGSGQAQAALDEANQALKATPDSAEVYNLLGLIRGTLGDNQLAEEAFRRSLSLAPGNGSTLHNYGWFLCQRQRWDEADAQFRAALAVPQYRESARTLLVQGICQARAGHWGEADKTLSSSFQLEPTNPVVAANLSDVLMHLGDYKRALFYIQRVNAVRAYSNAQTLWLAARIQHRLGDDAAARQIGDQLRDRFPQSAEAARYAQGFLDD